VQCKAVSNGFSNHAAMVAAGFAAATLLLSPGQSRSNFS
jgi:hypothetical protein